MSKNSLVDSFKEGEILWLGGIVFSVNKMAEKIEIFDTTLRDGEQTPGVGLTSEKKVEIAHALDKLGVDVIEAGFPIVSDGEARAIRQISNDGLNSEICGLARTLQEDIDRCISCDVGRIHTFIATSDIHMEHKLKMTPEQVIERAVWAVQYSKDHGVRVEFSAEDATRTRMDFLKEIFSAVTDAGAEIIDIPDTVGVGIPEGISWIVDEVKSVTDATIAVHCHNDMGLAVANTLAAIEAGATQAHCCINGIGERAGNAALEEVVVSLKSMLGVNTSIKMKRLYDTSHFVSRMMGIPIAPNKPIVGRNAFSHESGIHTHAVIESPLTYEPISPEMVGAKRRLVAGKHAGGHGVSEMLSQMGFSINKSQLKQILLKVKALGDKGIHVTDVDVKTIANVVLDSTPISKRSFVLEDMVVVTGTNITPTATVKILVNGKQRMYADNGVGPIDAALKAIQRASGEAGNFRLSEFRIEAISRGTDAVAETIVTLEDEFGKQVSARGVNEDIVTSGVEAIVEAINRHLDGVRT